MPAEMNCLGLPSDMLETHIAVDIGAGPLSDALARRLEAGHLTCGYSRLIIDPNRDPSAPDLIPAVADQIPVPGNRNLTAAEVDARLHMFHEPYHERLGAALTDLGDHFSRPLAVSVHSFTNRLMGAGDERPWGAGLLWRHDHASARFFIDWLAAQVDWPVGDNEPYDARVFNYSVDRHIAPMQMRHLTIEVRQDLIADEDGAAQMADLLARGVQELRKTL
jgi:predicted N-formylglutamate amidohydrolase